MVIVETQEKLEKRKIRLASESYEQKKKEKKSITMNPTKWFKSPGNL